MTSNEIMEISRQTKGLFCLWDGMAIQKIEGFYYEEIANYVGGDITFLCEIVPNKFKIDIHSFDNILSPPEEIEEIHMVPFKLSLFSLRMPWVELPRAFFHAKHIFVPIDKLNQAVREKLHDTPTLNPSIDQRCETSYKTIIAALLSKFGKYPFSGQAL